VTFTGSHEVGMHLYRTMAGGTYPRPCITEMGGKNACIVTARADLKRAVPGIVRSAYGLTGQKCSALSRVYVEESVADSLLEQVVEATKAITVGDPCRREIWMGPVINDSALRNFDGYCDQLRGNGGRILVGGERLKDGDSAHGHFAACTVAEAPADHLLFQEEMFVPILMVCRVKDVRDGVALANQSALGLTGGVYGDEEEVQYYLDNIEAGVLYVNRPQGATTGAWPGYQAFGGWKGSGSTGKAIGSYYYLPLYMREQSQTVVE
jgi:1-pyrroline-5-carboxylate dehydrogenase